MPLRGCGRRSGELCGVVEVRREGRQEVVVGGRKWGRGRGTSFCLLSTGGPAGEEGKTSTDRPKQEGPNTAVQKEDTLHFPLYK